MEEKVSDKTSLLTVIQLLRKYNLKETEELLKKEANINLNLSDDSLHSKLEDSSAKDLEIEIRLTENSYSEFQSFLDLVLEPCKHELKMINFPLFAHIYLALIKSGKKEQATKFMLKFGPDHVYCYQEDIKKLSYIMSVEHMRGNELVDSVRAGPFVIRMSRDSLSLLKSYLHRRKDTVLLKVIQKYLYFDMYEGVTRSCDEIDASFGFYLGEATRDSNRYKVYYESFKEPELQHLAIEDEEDGDSDNNEKQKKKKRKDQSTSKKMKCEANIPPIDRIPIPELNDFERTERIKVIKETCKRATLGPEMVPSICYYTLLNSYHVVTCAEICQDSSLLAVGYSDAIIKIWTLVPQKLRAMKPADQLEDIDKEADDVWVRMMDERTGEICRTLYGHSGAVYRVSFSADKTLFLSCSEDSSIRLWSLHTWTCLVVYKGHVFPVWDIRFAANGYYFVSASNDKTARLWATDHHQPLRIFAGHLSDVDCVEIHPNSNYVATGSSDRTVRLWDCVDGMQVRVMTGHKDAIYSLSFSVDGRFLASSGLEGRVLVWDLANGNLLTDLPGHTAPVHCLTFSRDGNILTSGSLDNTIKLWDFTKIVDELVSDEIEFPKNLNVNQSETYLIRSFATNKSGILSLHYTLRNLLLAVGISDS